MVKETKKRVREKWNFPGGHVEKNESFKRAAIREVKEETGLNVKLISILGICSSFSNGIYFIRVVFLASPKNYFKSNSLNRKLSYNIDAIN